jgi:hypothetical protein
VRRAGRVHPGLGKPRIRAWREWHPATRSVDGVPDRPLSTGETIVEHISAGGRRLTATWVVLAAEAPTLWVIATDTPLGIARIAYELRSTDGGRSTRFRRTLMGRSTTRPWRWLDPLLARLVLVPQSRRALDNLKRVVEARR